MKPSCVFQAARTRSPRGKVVARGALGLACVAITGLPNFASAQTEVPAVVLSRYRDVPGFPELHWIESFDRVAVDSAAGLAVVLRSRTHIGEPERRYIWISRPSVAPVLRAPGGHAGLQQGMFDVAACLGDEGVHVYSAPAAVPGASLGDSVWIGDTPLAISGDVVPSLVGGHRWTWLSHAGATATGEPYWLAGITDEIGAYAVTQSRGFFFGADATPKLLYGHQVPELGASLAAHGTVGPQYDVSPSGAVYIAQVRLEAPPGSDRALLVNGQALLAGSEYARTGRPVGMAGALQGEQWRSFRQVQITEYGTWAFTAQTSAEAGRDSVLAVRGRPLVREGGFLDGHRLEGAPMDLALNENRDVAVTWGLEGAHAVGVFVNGKCVLKAGDLVDTDGDGLADGTRVAGVRGPGALALTNRDAQSRVTVYVIAWVEPAGHTVPVEGEPAVLRVTLLPAPQCRADFDQSGTVNSGDISAFLASWSAMDPEADFDNNGAVNSADISMFLSVWVAETASCNS